MASKPRRFKLARTGDISSTRVENVAAPADAAAAGVIDEDDEVLPLVAQHAAGKGAVLNSDDDDEIQFAQPPSNKAGPRDTARKPASKRRKVAQKQVRTCATKMATGPQRGRSGCQRSAFDQCELSLVFASHATAPRASAHSLSFRQSTCIVDRHSHCTRQQSRQLHATTTPEMP
jgi:hypothetical protein